LEIIVEAVKASGADVVCHSFRPFRLYPIALMHLKKNQYKKGSGKLLKISRKTLPLPVEGILGGNNIMEGNRVQHGHSFVKREDAISVKFTGLRVGEDSTFLRHLLDANKKVVFLEQQLSHYFLGSRLSKAQIILRKHFPE
jgi:hypothetical protein